MTIKNEALRMFLAATALMLTWLLTNPILPSAKVAVEKAAPIKRAAASTNEPNRKYISIAGFRFRH